MSVYLVCSQNNEETPSNQHSLFSFQSNIHIFFIKNAIAALFGSKKKYLNHYEGKQIQLFHQRTKLQGMTVFLNKQALKVLSFLFPLLLNFHSDVCCSKWIICLKHTYSLLHQQKSTREIVPSCFFYFIYMLTSGPYYKISKFWADQFG